MEDKITYNSQQVINFAKNTIIVLVGMMGTGKTTVGKKISKILDVPFVDIDQEIEGDIGHSVSWIFENIGEKEFRKMERTKISEILSDKKPKIIALGGGAFLDNNSRELIKNNSISVWLKADAETIFKRVSARRDRPLLEGEEDKFLKIKRILGEREAIYSEADITILTDKGAQKKIVDKIIFDVSVFKKNKDL